VTARQELRHITDEIRAYPRPVAGCDAQFNHLLDRRAALEAALLADQTKALKCG